MSNFKIFISDVFDIKSEYYEKMQELIKNPNPLIRQNYKEDILSELLSRL